MPLNLSNRDQNSGHVFYNRRLRAALTRFSVRMRHDDRKQQAALAMSMVLVVLGCAWAVLLKVVKPVGVVGNSVIVGNRDTGALYARLEGRLHPAPNLISARLVAASADAPTWVSGSEIHRYPTGPMIGIPGLPDELPVAESLASAWAVCDTAGGDAVTVTAIVGELLEKGRAEPMPESQAILGVHDGATYLIFNGRRTAVNLADRAVAFSLGLDPRTARPVPVSNALFDAIPATEPLVVPVIPAAGAPSRWIPGATVGSVLFTEGAGVVAGESAVLLADGVQRISPFVAALLRTASRISYPPKSIPRATMAAIPEVHSLDVDFYPTAEIHFVETAANPVTCVGWQKNSSDRLAAVTVRSGRGLPIPEDFDSHVVPLVRDRREPNSSQAQQVLVLPGAATFVFSTGGSPAAETREAMFWVSPQGVRYGIEQDPETLSALALDSARAVQAPWPILRTFAAGPAISRAGALVIRDTIDPSAGAVAIASRRARFGGPAQ